MVHCKCIMHHGTSRKRCRHLDKKALAMYNIWLEKFRHYFCYAVNLSSILTTNPCLTCLTPYKPFHKFVAHYACKSEHWHSQLIGATLNTNQEKEMVMLMPSAGCHLWTPWMTFQCTLFFCLKGWMLTWLRDGSVVTSWRNLCWKDVHHQSQMQGYTLNILNYISVEGGCVLRGIQLVISQQGGRKCYNCYMIHTLKWSRWRDR